MSGGIVQLVATGIQDVHLTGNPEISFFRSNFKRHTHFAMSNERQLIIGKPGQGGTSTIRFEKKGDLLSYVFLTCKDGVGQIQGTDWGSLIDKVELLIGGQVIDTHDVYFSNTIAPLFISSTFSTRYTPQNPTPLFFPFQFWFCKDWQSALPLVGLQFHDVEIRISWSTNSSAWSATVPGGNTPSITYSNAEFVCWTNFIYLDKEERQFFADKPQDMIMWQMQRMVVPDNYIMETAFNHPVKFIAMPVQVYSNNQMTIKLQINGVDVGLEKPLPHYSQVAPYYHTQFGYDPTNSGFSTNPVALIAFCLDTTKLQPTGTLNFSRIDNFRLITNNACKMRTNILNTAFSNYLYAVNYNVLRINKGMAGLLYSN
jgi:hypothetical protein